MASAVAAVALMESRASILGFRLLTAFVWVVFSLKYSQVSMVTVRMIWSNCVNVSVTKLYCVSLAMSKSESWMDSIKVLAVSSESLLEIILAPKFRSSICESSR
jgi:hypothetical protein